MVRKLLSLGLSGISAPDETWTDSIVEASSETQSPSEAVPLAVPNPASPAERSFAETASDGTSLDVGPVVAQPQSVSTFDEAAAGTVQPRLGQQYEANQPIGVAKGLHPGRVTWVHDPNATSWDGSSNYWWDDNNTDQAVVDQMISKAIRWQAGESTDAAAWDAILRNYNQTHHGQNVGYTPGEKIAVKLNLNCFNDHWRPLDNDIDASPHLALALVRQLVNQAGVPQGDITLFDAQRAIPDSIYDRIHTEFPDVLFVARYPNNGRLGAQPDTAPENQIYLSGGGDEVLRLPTCVTEAKYLVNMAILKRHGLAGVSLTAKNCFGALMELNGGEWRWSPETLHPYFYQDTLGQYSALVELHGHKHLGGKTLLYIVDGLYGAFDAESVPQTWATFGNDWPSSIFLSQDPIAIDSVGLDFLRSEWSLKNISENYLHEGALAASPPSGTTYDPENDGTALQSLGVHEHWNNATDKQYSRNLGTGDGIELISEEPQSPTGVVGRYVFYNNSAWDGEDPGANAGDDAAIATDKAALLPGQTATFTNYTSYTGGINGLMIDISGLGNAAGLGVSDFEFRVGNDNAPDGWPAAPAPQSITVRAGAGVNGSDRVTIIWEDYLGHDQYAAPPSANGIGKQWLQVTVKATVNTGLSEPDVFYFGNAVGESGNSADDAYVNATDEIGARNNPRAFFDPAAVDDHYDYNRDTRVNATDEIIARNHGTGFDNALKLIPAPAGGGGAMASGEGSQPLGSPPPIVVGDRVLLANTPGQTVPIFVSSGTAVQGLNFNVQTPEGGPVIQDVDVLGGTIFEGNNNGTADLDGAGQDTYPHWEGRSVTTASGSVVADGLLATVTIDTTGLTGGSWTLEMSDTVNGPTDFAGVPAIITDGTLSVGARFDFGTADSPVESGQVPVTAWTNYGPATGYGWLSGAVLHGDRGPTGNDLTRDFNCTQSATFALDVPDGMYDVTLVLGDVLAFPRDEMAVYLEGQHTETVSAPPTQIITRTYRTVVSDGQLTLTLEDLGGSTIYVVIAGLEVEAAPADSTGPRVLEASPTGDVMGPVDRITLTFSEQIDPASFTTGDVTLTGPSGAITPTAINKLSITRYEVVFPEQTTPGSYSLTVGPEITDVAGNAMDQDQDGTKGEATEDQFTTVFNLIEPTFTGAKLDFGMPGSPLAPGYTPVTAWTTYNAANGYGWQSGTILHGDRGLTGDDLVRDFNITEAATFALDLPNGTYDVTLTLGDVLGFPRDQMAVYLESQHIETVNAAPASPVTRTYRTAVSDGQLTLGLEDLGGSTIYVMIDALEVQAAPADNTGPRVLAADPTGNVTGSADRITLTFNEQIDPASFTTDDVALAGPSGSITPTAINKLSITEYEVVFPEQTALGTYTLTVGPDVLDAAGNPMDQDEDGTGGEATEDRFTSSFALMAEAHFDFGMASSPVATGYKQVASGTLYTAEQGYGWQSGSILDGDRFGLGTDLTRDFNCTQSGTFVVDLPDGSYDVTMILGDLYGFPRDQMAIFLEGTRVDTVSTVPGEIVTQSYPNIAVADGQLTLELEDEGGVTILAYIEALDVVPAGSGGAVGAAGIAGNDGLEATSSLAQIDPASSVVGAEIALVDLVGWELCALGCSGLPATTEVSALSGGTAEISEARQDHSIAGGAAIATSRAVEHVFEEDQWADAADEFAAILSRSAVSPIERAKSDVFTETVTLDFSGDEPLEDRQNIRRIIETTPATPRRHSSRQRL